MLTIYCNNNGRVATHGSTEAVDVKALLWIDLLDPTEAEEMEVEAMLGLDVPTREEMEEIEPSSRLYEENGVFYLTATMLYNAHTDIPALVSISFLITPDALVTVRYADPMPFLTFKRRLEKTPAEGLAPEFVFMMLMETVIDRLADILETVNHKVDLLANDIFRQKQPNGAKAPSYNDILRDIGRQGHLLFKSRDSLTTTNRMLTFFEQNHPVDEEREAEFHGTLRMLQKDAAALGDYAGFTANNINLLLDAALGMVGLEQNATIKIFSVVAVVFMPPTLIASIYGMNFHYMPELGWRFGYPLAIALMLLAGWAPYKFFKKKGWL